MTAWPLPVIPVAFSVGRFAQGCRRWRRRGWRAAGSRL